MLFASNVSTELPSLVTPGGGAAWAQAVRAAELLEEGDFVLAPGNYELHALRRSQPGVETLNLTYEIDGTTRDRAFVEYVLGRISAVQARGGRVYVYALTEPLPAKAIGFWELMQGKHNVSRGALKEAIEVENRLVAANDLGSDMQRILPVD
jgi:hypothetical protein